MNLLKKYACLYLGFFISYKLTLYLGRDLPGDQPFYGYKLADWLLWLADYHEMIMLCIISLVLYCFYYLLIRKMTFPQIFLWGFFAGMYVSAIAMFDAISIIEKYDMVTSGLLLILVVLLPAGVAYYVHKISFLSMNRNL